MWWLQWCWWCWWWTTLGGDVDGGSSLAVLAGQIFAITTIGKLQTKCNTQCVLVPFFMAKCIANMWGNSKDSLSEPEGKKSNDGSTDVSWFCQYQDPIHLKAQQSKVQCLQRWWHQRLRWRSERTWKATQWSIKAAFTRESLGERPHFSEVSASSPSS